MAELALTEIKAGMIDAGYSRVFIDPDDFPIVPSAPFVVIRRAVDVAEYEWRKGRGMGQKVCIEQTAHAEIYVYEHRGEASFPSPKFAELEIACKVHESAIVSYLQNNPSLGGGSIKAGNMTTEFITPLQWGGEPYIGTYARIEYTRKL